MAAREEESVDGYLSQPPPTGLVSRLDDSRDENGGPAAVSETGKKEERKVQGEEREYFCGCGPWHPYRLQIFRDARFFTFLLCLFATIEGALVSGTCNEWRNELVRFQTSCQCICICKAVNIEYIIACRLELFPSGGVFGKT